MFERLITFGSRLAKKSSILSTVLLAGGLMVGCNDSPDGGGNGASKNGGAKRIVFLTNGDDPFWNACRAGMDKAAEDLKIADAGLSHNMDKGSEFDPVKQLAKLEQYATQTDIAGVAISPVDAENPRIAKALKNLRDQGVKVVCVDSDMDRDKFRDSRFAYLGTDNIIGGRELGRAAKALRPDGGKYATFVGVKTALNAIQRIDGFAEGAGEAFEQLDNRSDNADPKVAQDNVRSVLNNHQDIDALVGIWAYNAHAIVKVLEEEEQDRRDNVTVVVFDAAETALSDLEQKKIDAMIVQNPYQMGYLTVKLLKAQIEDDHLTIKETFPTYDSETGTFTEKDGDIFNTELRVVVPDENSPLKPTMFRKETKFYFYPEFRKWLDERRLVSS